MFQNNNREVIREMAMDNYRAHKTRNQVAILAIVLTTVLITAVFTVGISFTSTLLNYGESAPGPGCQGSVKATRQQCDEIRQLSQVEWADYVEKCSVSPIREKKFAGMQVWLMSAQESYYEHNYVDLLEGRYPESGEEIILSDSLAKRLGLDDPVGEKLTLRLAVGQDEQETEKAFTFTVCGYFKNPLIALVDMYDEIFTGPDFLSENNPQLSGKPGDVYVRLNNLNPLLLKSDVLGKLAEIVDAVGGYGYSTKYTSTFSTMLAGVIPAVLFVAIIVLSGYFLIYNVFYISVAADIRWFGMMKTIGTTPRQLKRILMVQIRRLAAIGIVIGIGIGYFVGNKLGPGVMAQTVYGQFYKAPSMLLVFLLGAVFSWLTVFISARKSMKIAASISPVEAARYAPKKRKNVFTVLSLALSGIIFMVACNATLGYNVEKMVERYDMDDCEILHRGSIWWLDSETYQVTDVELVNGILKLPYVGQMDIIYTARTQPDYLEHSGGKIYLDSLGQVRPQGILKEWVKTIKDSPEFTEAYGWPISSMFMENGDIRLKIKGVPAHRIMTEVPYIDILEGELDEEAFASGEYILWQGLEEEKFLESKDNDSVIHPGDVLTMEFYDDARGDYYEKSVTVMAVFATDDMFGTGVFGRSNVIMPDSLFQEIYPDYQKKISDIRINTRGQLTGKQNQEISDLVSQTYNSQLQMESSYLTRVGQEGSKRTMSLVGLFLAALLGIIGISNVVNTITSDVFARWLELAALQSIGMTRKQLWWMLLTDALKFSLAALALILPVGGVMSYLVTQVPLFTRFSLSWFVWSSILIILIVVLMDVLMTTILVRELNKKSIVERLREIE